MKIDLTLYLAEAIAKCKIGYSTIDRYYKNKKEEYYLAAKKSKYYNHPYLLEGTINQVEYGKKILGIISWCEKIPDENNIPMLKDIIKSCFPYAYTYTQESIAKNEDLSLTNFAKRLVKKSKGIDNLSDDDLNANAIAVVFLALLLKTRFIEDHSFKVLFESYLFKRPNILKGFKSALNSKSIQDLVKKNKEKLNLRHLNNVTLNREYYFKEEWFNLFTPLELSIDSILSDTKSENKLIEYLTISYYCNNIDGNEHKKIDFEDYIVPACLIYKLGQAYNEGKEYYLKNNREDQFIELRQTRNKLNDVTLERDNLRLELEDTNIKLEKALKEIQELKNEKEKAELIALRELFFSLDNNKLDDDYKEEEDYSKLQDIKDIVIIGGSPSSQQKIKEYIPYSIIIGSESFDPNILNQKNVFLFYKYMSHAMYYKILACNYNNLEYFSNVNIKLCLSQIYNFYYK